MKICRSHDHACLGTEGWSAHLRQHHQQQQQHPHPQKQQRRKLLHLHRIYRRHRKRRYHALLLCLLLLYQKYLSRVDLWASILRRFHRNLKNSRKMIQLFKKFLRKGRRRGDSESKGRPSKAGGIGSEKGVVKRGAVDYGCLVCVGCG